MLKRERERERLSERQRVGKGVAALLQVEGEVGRQKGYEGSISLTGVFYTRNS